jgi:hypothetical protein
MQTEETIIDDMKIGVWLQRLGLEKHKEKLENVDIQFRSDLTPLSEQ